MSECVTQAQIDEATRLAQRFGLRLPQGGAKRLALIVAHLAKEPVRPEHQIPITKEWRGWRVG